MKKILSILVILAGVSALAPASFAQDSTGGQVWSDKQISAPDPNGVYTISLEAFVTGSKVTTETLVPMDIVLCLAYNNSLLGYGAESLRKSVATFINIIQEKDIVKDETGQPTGDRVGYRIAIDYYGVKSLPDGVPSEAINTLHPVSMYDAQVSGNDGIVTYNGSNDIFPRSKNHMNGNEKANVGLGRANDILYGPGAEIQDNPVVVFFTNGTPGAQSGSGWNGGQDTHQAISAMEEAYTIKENGATVIAVGLYDSPGPDNMTDWLYLTSSDYVDESDTPLAPPSFPRSTPHQVTGVNSIIGSVNELVNIFSAIASSIGGNYNIGSASSTLIDIVSSSFTVSTSADLGQTKVYRVPCNDDQPGMVTHSFNDDAKEPLDVVASEEEWKALTEEERETTVILTVDDETGEVVVSGFDYGANWCGYETNETTGQHGPHGYKILLEIPVTANVDAVGGPNVHTNADGSGLIIRDDEGNQVGDMIEFISPEVSLPVNIYVTKTGLQKGESAKFMIERAFINMETPPTPDEYDGLDWKYVTTLFVTNDGEHETITKIRGLPSEGIYKETPETPDEDGVKMGFLYRISEEGWSWTYSSNTDPQFTDTSHVDNPFTFENEKQKDVEYKIRNAESKVTNIFDGSATQVYVDSKGGR